MSSPCACSVVNIKCSIRPCFVELSESFIIFLRPLLRSPNVTFMGTSSGFFIQMTFHFFLNPCHNYTTIYISLTIAMPYVFSNFIIYLVCDFVIQSACTHRLSSSPCQLLSHKMSHHKKGIFFCFSLMMALA